MAPALIVAGVSTGGLSALEAVLSALPEGFSLPVVVVQHRAPGGEGRLPSLLGRCCALPVVEPDDKEPLRPGRVYLAPPDYHLLVEPGRLSLSTGAPEHHARPSVDVLFESAALAYGDAVVGVVLTGASPDGARGLAEIEARGGGAVVQEPESAEAAAMPEAALQATGAPRVLPLPEIGPFLAGLGGDPEEGAT